MTIEDIEEFKNLIDTNLNDFLSEKNDIEEKLKDANSEIKDLKYEIEELKDETAKGIIIDLPFAATIDDITTKEFIENNWEEIKKQANKK